MWFFKFFAITTSLILLAASPTLARPLVPNPYPSSSESNIDRYFRIAHNSALKGDFDTAIINYQRVMNATRDKCEKQHAAAGVQSAKEGKEILKKSGWRSRPTQHYGIRLLALTESLSCVTLPSWYTKQ